MPAFYAHKLFSERVFACLPLSLQKDFAPNKIAFFLGAESPDLLFYHKPLTKNAIRQKGSDLHHVSAKPFFVHCAEIIGGTVEKTQSVDAAYVAGCICHFMLDNACHPHVYKLEDTGVSHGLIESEFDKYLKRQQGKRVHKNAAKGLTGKHGIAPAIARVLQVEVQEVQRAIKTMKRINGCFSCPLRSFHALARVVLKKIHADKFESMFLHFKDDAACTALNPALQTQMDNAVENTAQTIQTFFNAINHTEHPVFDIFDKDYKGEQLV